MCGRTRGSHEADSPSGNRINMQEKLPRVESDMVSSEGQILNMDAQVAIMWEARFKAVSQAEAMEIALSEEKQILRC